MHAPQNSSLIEIRHETGADEAAIEKLASEAFGPGRFARAAFRLREGVMSEAGLSFVATLHGALAGSVKLTRILIGDRTALVLGPLIVDPVHRKFGIGRELMNRALFNARQAQYQFVILVGDYDYYRQFGFERVPPGQITLPGPADPARILACELEPGVAENYQGLATRFVQR